MGSGRSSILRWAAPATRRRRRSRRPPAPRNHRPQTLGRRRGLLRRRPGPRTLLGLVAVILLLAGAWLWLRDSSLVAVHKVRVSGASGPDAAQIRSALIAAAHNMTTLDVNMKQLRTAVAPYPVVKSLAVATQFPHGMKIRVIEQVPVAVIDAGGRRVTVAGDGTLLRDAVASTTLPIISLPVVPGGTHVTGYALSEVKLLAAAPYALLSKVDTVTDGSAHGLVAKLRNGPSIYFGESTQLSAKWTAAAEVLADSRSFGAVYIDVTDPSRPAGGAGTDVNGSSASSTAAASAHAGTATTAAAAQPALTITAQQTATTPAAPTPTDASQTDSTAGTASTPAAGTALTGTSAAGG